jgi:hypothetical protein
VCRGFVTAHPPCALVLAVPALDNLVLTGENLLLEDLGAPAFVDAGDFEYLGRVYI